MLLIYTKNYVFQEMKFHSTHLLQFQFIKFN